MCVSLGSLYMCNACVLRVYMCVCVHVLQITTVSLSVKLSFLYFSLCSLSTFPFPPFPSFSTSVYSEIIYRVYMNSISRALTNRISRGDRVSPKKKKGKKTGTAKVTEKKWWKKKRTKKVDPRRPINIYLPRLYIHIHVALPTPSCRYFLLPSGPLPTPSRSRHSFLPLRFFYFASLSPRTSILIETPSIPLACYQFLQLALRSVLPLSSLFIRFLKSTLKFT